MRIVIVAATERELDVLKQKISALVYDTNKFNISYAITGVGILASTFSLTKLLIEHSPQLVIQAGIAGTYDPAVALASVFAIQDETVADTGVYESDIFKDLFDLELLLPNETPYCNKRLINPHLDVWNITNLNVAGGITVNEICTDVSKIQHRLRLNPLALESMEGASLHYCCLLTQTPFMQIRAVSNIVGERNKKNWQIEASLENLSLHIFNYLQQIFTQYQSIYKYGTINWI